MAIAILKYCTHPELVEAGYRYTVYVVDSEDSTDTLNMVDFRDANAAALYAARINDGDDWREDYV